MRVTVVLDSSSCGDRLLMGLIRYGQTASGLGGSLAARPLRVQLIDIGQQVAQNLAAVRGDAMVVFYLRHLLLHCLPSALAGEHLFAHYLHDCAIQDAGDHAQFHRM